MPVFAASSESVWFLSCRSLSMRVLDSEESALNSGCEIGISCMHFTLEHDEQEERDEEQYRDVPLVICYYAENSRHEDE